VHGRYPRDVSSVRAALLALLRRSISNARAMGVDFDKTFNRGPSTAQPVV
jgi:hypothetical protein